MKISGKTLTTGAIVGAMILFLGGMVLMGCDEERERGEKIALSQLPPAVKATIDRESQGGTIKETEKITEGGKTVYGADIVVGGKEQEVIVAEDGTVLKRGNKEGDD